MKNFPEIDLGDVTRISISSRKNKVNTRDFCKFYIPNDSFGDFWRSLPSILKANDLRAIVTHIADAYENRKTVLAMFGAHVIKCGLNPILIEWMKRGIISALAGNGACAIHDFEVAMWGETSEDVATNIENGTFGMAKETGDTINLAVRDGAEKDWGFGESVGKKLVELSAPHGHNSLLVTASQKTISMTIHVAIGTDIIHQHPSADGAAIGKTSYTDFKKFVSVVSTIGDGGVVLNFGSAVMMPEVFLKALTICRNLGYDVKNFVTANFDMNQQYRPTVNVVKRPVLSGGKGYAITGHHEIMIPLLSAGIFYELSQREILDHPLRDEEER